MCHKVEAFFMSLVEVTFLDWNQTKDHAAYDVEYEIFWNMLFLADRCVEDRNYNCVFSKDK